MALILVFIFMEETQSYQKKSQGGLMAAIVFASLVIGGSLVFLGMQFSSGGTQANVDELSKDQLAALLQEKESQVDAGYDDIIGDDPVMGDPDAPVTLIEFSDYQCPFCRRHFTNTMPQIKSEYIDTGKVKYVFRDAPIPSHADGFTAAYAAECVREQKGDAVYFEYNEKIFEGDWRSTQS